MKTCEGHLSDPYTQFEFCFLKKHSYAYTMHVSFFSIPIDVIARIVC